MLQIKDIKLTIFKSVFLRYRSLLQFSKQNNENPNLSPKQQSFTWLKHAKTTLFHWTAP